MNKNFSFHGIGGIPCAYPGDKSYAVPEYSKDFHKEGSTRPAINFSRTNEVVADTFIPLSPLTAEKRDSFRKKEKLKREQEEVDSVKQLDDWKPAPPLTIGL